MAHILSTERSRTSNCGGLGCIVIQKYVNVAHFKV